MSKPITLPWNAAAWRQDTYAPRVTKVHGPVGEYVWDGDVPTHRCCGYHVCSCPSDYPAPDCKLSFSVVMGMTEPELRDFQGALPSDEELAALDPHGTWCKPTMRDV